jgi:hypothetical protein
MFHFKKSSALIAVFASLALAPAALASGGPNPAGGGAGGGGGAAGGGGGGGGGGGAAASCQIRQFQNVGFRLVTGDDFVTSIQLAGCANDSYSLTYVNNVSGTTDSATSGVVGPTGTLNTSFTTSQLPFNFPYTITLTVTDPTGAVAASSSTVQFDPIFRD